MWSCYLAVCVISALAVSKALMLETQVALHSNRALVSVGKAKEKTPSEIECKATKTEENIRKRNFERERNKIHHI
jgi:hypothetical protein